MRRPLSADTPYRTMLPMLPSFADPTPLGRRRAVLSTAALTLGGISLWTALSNDSEERRFAAAFLLWTALALYRYAQHDAGLAGRQLALRRRYPDEPWRWREDWNEGRARSLAHTTATSLLFGGMLLLLIAGAIPSLLVLVASIAMLTGWLRYRLSCLLHGDPDLHLLSPFPFEPGAEFRASVAFTRRPPRPPFRFRLTCVLRSEIADEETMTLVFQDEILATASECTFRLPTDIPGSTPDGKSSAQRRWRLDVGAGHFQARYELPVFGEAASQPEPAELAASGYGAVHEFPAGRNPKLAVGALAALAAGLLLTFFLSRLQVPSIFPVLTAAFTILVSVAVGGSYLASAEIDASAETLSLRSRWGPFSEKTRRWDRTEIASIGAEPAGWVGNRLYYHLTLRNRWNKRIILSRSLTYRDAVETAAALSKRLRLPQELFNSARS